MTTLSVSTLAFNAQQILDLSDGLDTRHRKPRHARARLHYWLETGCGSLDAVVRAMNYLRRKLEANP